jgi:hypothetical protein
MARETIAILRDIGLRALTDGHHRLNGRTA